MAQNRSTHEATPTSNSAPQFVPLLSSLLVTTVLAGCVVPSCEQKKRPKVEVQGLEVAELWAKGNARQVVVGPDGLYWLHHGIGVMAQTEPFSNKPRLIRRVPNATVLRMGNNGRYAYVGTDTHIERIELANRTVRKIYEGTARLLAVRDDTVVVLERPGGTSAADRWAIVRVDLGTSTKTVLATGDDVSEFGGFVSVKSADFWVAKDVLWRRIKAVPASRVIALDGSILFAREQTIFGVQRETHDGPDALISVEVLSGRLSEISPAPHLECMAVVGDNVYFGSSHRSLGALWGHGDGEGRLWRVRLTGGTSELVATGFNGCNKVIGYKGFIYFSNATGIYRIHGMKR